MNDTPPARSMRWAIVAIMVAVLSWGVFHAVGAYRYNHNPLRALMVLACVVVFLGFWGAMLFFRGARR